MSAGNATIQKLAPQFTATAVLNGDFKDVSLSDYSGKNVYVLFGKTKHLK